MRTNLETASNTVCIIQARMGSTRLPGKVMKRLAGKEVLWHVVNRVRQCADIDQIIVATTTLPRDDRIADYCATHEWRCYRGSESDVLDRYVGAATEMNAEEIIRVTSDCPLIEPNILSDLIRKFRSGNLDYLSTNYPTRTFPVGTDCEIMSISALVKANAQATDRYDREHVTPYFYRNKDVFEVGGLKNRVDQSGIRLTLDTSDDLELITAIYNRFYKASEILRLEDAVNYVSRTAHNDD